jgi:hypothetical protein
VSRRACGAAPLLVLPLLLAAACTAPAPPWIELFDGRTTAGFEVTSFGGEGDVAARDGALYLGMGSPLTGVTWTGALPTGDYELEVTACRDLGSDFFCGVTFPVGDSFATLVLGGWGGSVCGLSNVDGLDAARNPTRTLRQFPAHRRCTARVQVTAARIAVTLDGGPLCAVERAGRTIDLRAEMLPSRPLGVATFATAARVFGLRWRPLRSP